MRLDCIILCKTNLYYLKHTYTICFYSSITFKLENYDVASQFPTKVTMHEIFMLITVMFLVFVVIFAAFC